MNKDFYFCFNDKEVTISMDLDQLYQIPKKIQTPLFKNGRYEIQSSVDFENVNVFLKYFFDHSQLPTFTKENAYDFKVLCDEFDINFDFDSSKQINDILKLSIIAKSKNLKDKSNCEKFIAQNLDFFLDNYEKDMLELPINSLHNIFKNKERTLQNENRGYEFIIKSKDACLYSLLPTLHYMQLSEKYQKDSLSKLNEHFEFMPENDFSLILHNENLKNRLYVANIKNRLGEMTNPTSEDKIRWAMELIQNAKDSLYSSTNLNDQKKIQITFDFFADENNEYMAFSHNGPPFSIDSYYGLIYKISHGKDNDKTTGRFGTGFLTTHVLSKTVDINGDISNDNIISGFFIRMIREGRKDDEIIKNLKEMEKSKQEGLPAFKKTQFKYEINSEVGKECAKKGLIHLQKHIYNVLINCPDIEHIIIKNNDTETKYTAQIIKQINSSIFLYKVFRNNDSQDFIVVKDDTNKISISIRIDNQSMIIPPDFDTECLYTVFPLVGSNEHVLPFSINCPKFEPVTERNALVLEGKEEINGEKTKVWTNRDILMKSICLFKNLILYLKECKCSNMYELSNGLILTKKPYSSFDLNWYNEIFLREMREILICNASVKTFSDEDILLKDAFFPSKEIEDNKIAEFINLKLTKKYHPKIISVNDCLSWRNKLWDINNYVTIEDIIKKVQNDDSILKEQQLQSLNELISFIYNYKKELLEKHPFELIPNMENKFQCYSINLHQCKTVTDDMIQIMETVGIPWKATHVNKMINSIDSVDDKMIVAENQIVEKIKDDKENDFENSTSLRLMQFVLADDIHRKNMFDFVLELEISKFSQITVSNINPNIWFLADDFVLSKMVTIISKLDSDTVKNKINFFVKFIPFFRNHFAKEEEFMESAKIIPNGNYNLGSLKELCNKSAVFHDLLNPIMIRYFNIDFNENIINTDINSVAVTRKDEQLYDFLKIIAEKITTFQNDTQILIAELIISLVPKIENKTFYEINQIFSIYQKLINPNLKKITVGEETYGTKYSEIMNYYEFFNKIVLIKISKVIEGEKSLVEFQKKFSLDEKKAFEILNFVYNYDYLLESNQIVPNKKGDFKLKKDLKSASGIDDELIELISEVDSDSNIKDKIAHSCVEIKNMENYRFQDFQIQFKNMMKKAQENSNLGKDKNAKIKKYLEVDVTSGKMSEKDTNKLQLLKDSHYSFLKNRIRESNSPKLEDLKRWPFELIQNGTDCIQDEKDQQSPHNGSMFLGFGEGEFTFIHYGAPFTYNDFLSLLYQYGGGKDGNKSKIGRFGTGFLSTLVLARTIHVEGDLLPINGEQKISGFEVTIDRNGKEKEDLKKGIDNMEQSLIMTEKKGETKFVFKLPQYSDENEKFYDAYNEGLKSLKENIPQILIFNPSIKKITLKTKDDTLIFQRTQAEGPIRTISIQSNKQTIQRTFIYHEINERFEYKSENISKNVKVNCLLEVGSNNNIIHNNDFLFLSFPMFGLKQFNSPIIINSLDFEPKTERDDIIVEQSEENKDSYQSAVNKFIIGKSVEIFREIVKIAINRRYIDLYNLCYGLNDTLKAENFFKKHFIEKMKEIILSFPIFETSGGFRKYDSILIPVIDRYEDLFERSKTIQSKNEEENKKLKEEENKKIKERKRKMNEEFYQIVSNISIIPNALNEKLSKEPAYLVKYDHCNKWLSLLWPSFPSKINIDRFLEYISMKKDIKQLNYIGNESIESFYRKFIQFIEKMNNFKGIINNYSILMNVKGELVSAQKIYKFNITKSFYEIMDAVKYNYSKYTLHSSITHLYNDDKAEFQQFDIKNAIQSIKDNITPTNYILLMKYVIENDDKRETLFEYSKFYLDNSLVKVIIPVPKSEYCNDLKEMFNRADEYAIKLIIEKIQNDSQHIRQNIDLIHKFVAFLKNHPTIDLLETRIFPDQLYKLRLPKELKKDLIQNENVKNILENTLHYALREELMIDSFVTFANCETYTFQNISQKIFNLIQNQWNGLNENDRIQIYSIVLSNSLKTNESLLEIVDLVRYFFKKQIILENKDDATNCFSHELTEAIIKKIIEDINRLISNYSNINDFKQMTADPNLIYQKLSTLYKFSLKLKCNKKIFPTEKGVLKQFNEIKFIFDPQIDKKLLYDLLEFIIQLQKSENLRELIINQSIEITSDIKDYLTKENNLSLDWFVDEIKRHGIRFDIYFGRRKNPHHDYKGNGQPSKYFFSHDKFLNFIQKSEKLKVAFAEIWSKTLPFEFVQNRDQLYSYYKTNELFEEIEKQIDLSDISPYSSNDLNIIILYEKIKNSKIFSNVNCPVISNNYTNRSVQYNNKTYYLNNTSFEYDIDAEDRNNRKVYFVVKLSTDGFHLTSKEINFVQKLKYSEIDNNFGIFSLDNSNKVSLQLFRNRI